MYVANNSNLFLNGGGFKQAFLVTCLFSLVRDLPADVVLYGKVRCSIPFPRRARSAITHSLNNGCNRLLKGKNGHAAHSHMRFKLSSESALSL